MGHAVRGQHGKVFRMEPVGVADFHGVLPALGRLREKTVQCGDKIPAVFELAWMKMGELKDQRAYAGTDGLETLQETHFQQIGTEEEIVLLPGPLPEGGELRKGADGDIVRHLEGKDEVLGSLRGDRV